MMPVANLVFHKKNQACADDCEVSYKTCFRIAKAEEYPFELLRCQVELFYFPIVLSYYSVLALTIILSCYEYHF